MPTISVILPVYNAATYLAAAIDSILHQTAVDFELCIIDDGSTDRSAEIISSYTDSRIRFVSRPNHGLTATLNELIHMAQGEYIARMDGDDISAPQRLERQLAFLREHPDVVLVGTRCTVMNEQGQALEEAVFPTDDFSLRLTMLWGVPFCHGSVMYRRQAALDLGPEVYRTEGGNAEDFDLWSRFALIGGLANIPAALYQWRTNAAGISLSQPERQAQFTRVIAGRNRASGDFQRRLRRSWVNFSAGHRDTLPPQSRIPLMLMGAKALRQSHQTGLAIRLLWWTWTRFPLAFWSYMRRPRRANHSDSPHD